MATMGKQNLRAIVLDILMQADEQNTAYRILQDALIKFQYLEKQERSFISRLTLGTVERQIELDYIIDQFAKTPARKQKPLIRFLLEMSVYQLKYMDQVPASAVCNEAVKLAEKRGFYQLKGFVNGVLRSVARGLDTIIYPDMKEEPTKALSVRYSMPEWLVTYLQNYYENAVLEKMFEALQKERKIYIRCNTSRITPECLKGKLEAEGVRVLPAKILYHDQEICLDYAFEIQDFDYLAGLESFTAGEFYVQDISSMLASEGGLIAENAAILDVCASPGGKSINAALKATKGTVTARDVSDFKVARIEENLERLGINNVIPKVQDATLHDDADVEQYDVVIADLPCSGLGIMGRKPDIRYHLSVEKIQSLAQLQKDIIAAIWNYVKPGGYLIYSTCTINPAENDENVDWIMSQYPYELVEVPIQLLPDENHMDGFFIARLQRKSQ